MRERFQAYRIHQTNGHISSRIESLALDDLSAGEITVRVHYATMNYKDGLAGTGKRRILRLSPLVGGIDLTGEVIASDDSGRPLDKAGWSGAIDNVGGDILAELTRCIDYFGNIASIGLVAVSELYRTVMPFILRGVNFLRTNSGANSREVRLKIWDRLACDLRPRDLSLIYPRTISFSQLPLARSKFLRTERRGRTLVDMRGNYSAAASGCGAGKP